MNENEGGHTETWCPSLALRPIFMSTLHGLWATTMNENEGGPIFMSKTLGVSVSPVSLALTSVAPA
jgi:hypothetical protein